MTSYDNGPLLATATRITSAMLFAVRHFLVPICVVVAAVATVAMPAESRNPFRQQAPLQPPPAPQINPAPPVSAPQVPAGPVIVLDPAHGGTDTGARGPEGRVEKDLVLQIVGTMRAELERRGYRVVTTRNDDSNPSYDDRAGIANAYPGAVFVSIHISSTGKPGIAQAYYDQFGTNVAPVLDGAGVTGVAERPANPPPGGLTNWNEAQRSFLDPSHRLANLIQLQLTQIFPGSPTVSEAAAVRGLRSIDEPAVAVELSSVSTSSPDSLRAAAAPLARAIAQSAAAFRQGGPGEAR